MHSKILESDEVDSKYFKQAFGRLFTMVNDLIEMHRETQDFLEKSFHVPPSNNGAYTEREDMETDDSGDDDDE